MNLSGVLDIFPQLPVYDELLSTSDADELSPLHLPRSVRAALLSKIFVDGNRPILLVCGRVETVSIWQQNLEAWLPPGINVVRFPEPTPLPFERAPWSLESRLGRISTLTRLMEGTTPYLPKSKGTPLIITSARALLQKTLPKRDLVKNLRVIKLNQILDLNKTMDSWEAIGYERVTVVEQPCQFSSRGGIIDIYPATAIYPVRIELFGDEVDTLRYFDPATQRTISNEVTQLVIAPAREALPMLAPKIGTLLEQDAPPKEDDLPAWQDDIEDLIAGVPTAHLEYYLPLLYRRPGSLLDYLPDDTRIVVDDWHDMQLGVRDLQAKAAQVAGQQMTLPDYFPSPLFAWEQTEARLVERGVTVLGEVTEEAPAPDETAPLEIADLIQPGPRHGGQERPFLSQLQRTAELGQRMIVVSRQAQRLAEMWRNHRGDRGSSVIFSTRSRPVENLLQLPEGGKLTFVQGTLTEGFVVEDERGNALLHLLTDAEVFGWNRPTPRRRRVKRAVAPETYFSDIEPNDYVVHIEYGVGQFMGMVVRTIGGAEREYLQLNYANKDVLYIPVHHADRLSKWVGSEINAPEMHRVGQKSWSTAKKKAQAAVNELADELLELYASRETISGHAFAEDTEWQAELEAAFPYEETDDQLAAIEAVKSDMERVQPMDRLICGDVGFGKTEVAVRAAFKAVMEGKQVAVLVPTTVLAQQHYKTFRERMQPFPVSIGILSRFQTQSQNTETIRALRGGKVDVVIGTHRLLSEDVGFKDLGLVVIDEEQRFGVGHKTRLKQLRTEVDVLTMTATPIPRTLHMGLAGMRDISIINTPPSERLPVVTYVGASDDNLIKRAILRELDRGGQVFFVHNHVQTILNAMRYVETLVPDARIAIGHGQMNEGELEDVMRQFADHELDILVCTTIIESGLDIPNANTMIVDRAELFGLAQLYQLRGRVGRGMRRAYSYFFHSAWRTITPEARARLETLDENTDLGAGYTIAMRDLEIRGAGELLGGNQSGHIASVGFDLYTRMLARAVRARKAAKEGKMISAEIPDAVTIDLPIPSYLPTDYIPDAALRLRLYRRMAGLESLESIDEVSAELEDRFGPLPSPVANLLYSLRVKVLAAKAGVSIVISEAGQVRIKMPLERVDRASLQRYLGEGMRVGKQAIYLDPEMGTSRMQIRLVQALERLGAWFEERNAIQMV